MKMIIFKKLLLATSICFFCFSCSTKQNDSKTDDKIKPEFQRTIETAEAELQSPEKDLALTGKVDYDPDKVISYIPLMNGVVTKTYFSLGDKVQKGQTLLDIRSTDINSMQAEYTSAEAELSVAEREYRSAKELYEDNMLSEKELAEAQSKLKQAKATYERAKNDMSEYNTGKGNGIFSIKSPMSGYIVDKKITTGSTISADSEPIFMVADLSTVWVVANVYAGNLTFVREGMNVEIQTLSYKDEIFKGKINNLSQVFDSDEKVLKARIKLENKDLKLKPEMSAVINLKDKGAYNLIAIPSDALIFDNDKNYVVVEEAPKRYSVREVKLQGHNGKTTYISSGINQGEKVVVKNQLFIYSGEKEE